jgi:hypothetical protein
LGLWRGQGQRHVGQLSPPIALAAATADGKRIRWGDLDIVVKGVAQFNSDLAPDDVD